MTPFFAIVKLTCRSAVRSHVFRFLLFLLMVCVILAPNTLKGDGTAQGYLQVTLEYSTALVAMLLSTSIIWLTCAECCTDVENGQVHLIFVKPVSRVTVWLGKFAGVFLIHGVLLALAFTFIYIFLMWQYRHQKFTPAERARMENEVFAGRQAFTPDLGDLKKKVAVELAKRVETAKKLGEKLPDMNGVEFRRYVRMIRMEIIARMGEVKPGQWKTWNYSGLPEQYEGPVYIGYRMYSGNLGSASQKRGNGFWFFRYVQRTYDENARDKSGNAAVKSVRKIPVRKPAEPVLTRVYHEFEVPGPVLIYKGTASIGFANLQSNESEILHFQVTESPRLLLKETSFLNNYLRVMLAVALGLFALGMVAGVFSAFVTMPTAVFLTLSYLTIGAFSSYLAASIESAADDTLPLLDRVGMTLAKVMMALLIPMQNFLLTGRLATGTLIEFSVLARLVVWNILVKGLLLGLFGVWMYRRRETALAVRR